MAFTVTLKKCIRCEGYKPLGCFKSAASHICERCTTKKVAA